MEEFAAEYREKVLPILTGHGLKESPERGRATVDNVFARLFQAQSASGVVTRAEALQEDPAWQAVLRDLGATFGTARPDSLIRQSFRVYTTPVRPAGIVPTGPGKTVPAGLGSGRWHAFGMADGLPEGYVATILQDRDGYLWFGTRRGVSRYDGSTFTCLTTEDGLADNYVLSMLQDRASVGWLLGPNIQVNIAEQQHIANVYGGSERKPSRTT